MYFNFPDDSGSLDVQDTTSGASDILFLRIDFS